MPDPSQMHLKQMIFYAGRLQQWLIAADGRTLFRNGFLSPKITTHLYLLVSIELLFCECKLNDKMGTKIKFTS